MTDQYSRVKSPYGGSATYTNPGMIALISTYCAIKGISLKQFGTYQGSFNTGVAASAGTHDKADCIDGYDSIDANLLKKIGAFGWHRTRAQGFMPHVHFGRMYSTKMAWLATAQDEAYREHQSNGLGNLSHKDTSWCPRYRGVKHLSGPTTQRYVAMRPTHGYSQAGCDPKNDADLVTQTRATGYALTNVAGKVRCQGKDYYVTTSATFYLAADFAKDVPMRTTEFTVFEQNCASDHANWTTRARTLNKRIRKYAPHFVSAVELYDDRRAVLSLLLKTKYAMTTHNHGKVQFLVRSTKGWVKVASKHYDLGNGKDAAAVRYRHRSTGAEYVHATAHLSWQHDAAADRTGEAKRLVSYLERDFDGLPWLITGDMNDSHKSISTRPKDSSGAVFKAAGLHDLYFDCANADKHHAEYNTANSDKTPPPKDAVHIDRYWASHHFEGLEWTCDVYSDPRGSDHWGVAMKLALTHPR